jgi:methyl-accepting chemotaxis protein
VSVSVPSVNGVTAPTNWPAETEVQAIVSAAADGDFSARLESEGKTGFFRDLSRRHEPPDGRCARSLNDLARVLNAIARGDLTEKITADYGGTFGQLKDDTNTTVERLREVVGQIKEASESINVRRRRSRRGTQTFRRGRRSRRAAWKRRRARWSS